MKYSLLVILFCLSFLVNAQPEKDYGLTYSFDHPPMSARSSCYWWWFNSLMDKDGITHDLEEFKAKGMGGVMIVCSGNGYGVNPMPQGPIFLSLEWRELYRYALKEANRLGLEVGVNFCGGWDMGGPWITPENSGRWFLQSELTLNGPQKFSGTLPLPGTKDGYDSPPQGNVPRYINLPIDKADYRDVAVVAFREPAGVVRLSDPRRKTLPAKSNRLDANCFLPARQAMDQTLTPWTTSPDDQPIAPGNVMDLTSRLGSNGHLNWDVPEGTWTIMRTGHRMTGQRVNAEMPSSDGLEVDWFSTAAVDQQWEHLGKILLADAGSLAGKTLKYFATDSFEDGYPNWTDKMLEQFKRYRGYDAKPYLPVFSGRLVGNARISDRFLYDYRKTVADCMADNNYGHFAELSHAHNLGIACEAAGPSWSGTMCMDGLKNLGRCDMPQGEFWQDKIFVVNGQNKVGKQTATAAHIYGHKTASAESFTSLDLPHWSNSPNSLKPTADRAFCEGINRFVFHTMTATRPQDGLPGYEYGAGTHFNPNVTWWQQTAEPWLAYINRCQTLLQSGLFVADVLYYNGDWAPNLVEAKHVDPSLGKGYDYDVCNAEVLLTRLSVKDDRIALPDGMSYRLLVLPESKNMPVEVLKKIKQLVEAGATVIGPKPEKDPGLRNYPQCDADVKKAADYLWGDNKSDAVTDRKVGKGRIITGITLHKVLLSYGIKPDFEVTDADSTTFIDYIHRTTPEAEIYFLANRNGRTEKLKANFRVNDRSPELWNPVNGGRQKLSEYGRENERTSITLEFGPYESMFILFPRVSTTGLVQRAKNSLHLQPIYELTGAWDVQFNKEWLYPTDGLNREQANGLFKFNSLDDWSKRPEEALRYFSGTAIYKKTFDISGLSVPINKEVFLDLGIVKESARVRLNGKDLGVVWCNPWQVDISEILKAGENSLEIEVVNLWPNRLIGDSRLPTEKRKTRTNVTSYKPDSHLLSSGLLGPVRVMLAEQ